MEFIKRYVSCCLRIEYIENNFFFRIQILLEFRNVYSRDIRNESTYSYATTFSQSMGSIYVTSRIDIIIHVNNQCENREAQTTKKKATLQKKKIHIDHMIPAARVFVVVPFLALKFKVMINSYNAS